MKKYELTNETIGTGAITLRPSSLCADTFPTRRRRSKHDR